MNCVPLNKRLSEWIGALMFCGLGLELAMYPGSVGSSAFRYMLEIARPQFLVGVYVAVGLARLMSLVLNGKLAHGWSIRATCSFISAVIWLQMAVALLRFHVETGNPPDPNIPICAVLFLAEVYSTYRAVSDGRTG